MGAAAGPVIGGVIGAGASMMSANSASSAAESAARKQQESAAADLAFRREMYDYEKRMTGPIRERLTTEAMSDQPLDYGMLSAQIKQNYEAARRKFAGVGNSGLAAGSARGMELSQASDLSNAYSQGMAARRNLQQGLLGRDQSAQMGSGYAGALGSMANLYGQQAGMYRQAAQQGWQGVGQGVAGIGYGIGKYYGDQAGNTTTPIVHAVVNDGDTTGRASAIAPWVGYGRVNSVTAPPVGALGSSFVSPGGGTSGYSGIPYIVPSGNNSTAPLVDYGKNSPHWYW